MKTTKNKSLESLQPIDQMDSGLDKQNPNPKMSESDKKHLKKKQIIGIIVVSVLLAIAITLTVLTYTVFKK